MDHKCVLFFYFLQFKMLAIRYVHSIVANATATCAARMYALHIIKPRMINTDVYQKFCTCGSRSCVVLCVSHLLSGHKNFIAFFTGIIYFLTEFDIFNIAKGLRWFIRCVFSSWYARVCVCLCVCTRSFFTIQIPCRITFTFVFLSFWCYI